jgi:hypothetical protein
MADLKNHKTYENTRFEILTNDGFKDFKGMMAGYNECKIKLTFDDGTQLTCTPKHKLMLTSVEWIYAELVKAGDVLYGNKIVSGIENYKSDDVVYDFLEIADNHTYYANGVLSHQCLIVDEAAFIEPHLMEPFWASVFPIVSSSKKSKVFICSTPNGTGNLFYNIYTGSLENKNGWVNDKILWNEVPGRDERWVKEIKGGLASEEKWQQEFECKFLNSGTGSMSEESYNAMKQYIIPPVETLMDGKYKLFDKPQPDRIYVAGVDTAEGIGKDYSCVKILDITDLKNIIEVAEYYDNTIPVSEFANKVREILSHWGDPLVCVERNNQGGQVVDRLGYDMGYINKIVSWGAKLAGRKNTQLLGMVASRNTKYNAVANARYYYNDKMVVEFRNEASLDEVVKDFVKLPNDSWGAISGKHDDRTMALIWALMILHDEIIDQYFSVDELDDCGKPCKISPLDYGVTYFENPTSIYTNEQIEGIENSQISPIYFGASTQQSDDIAALELEGWTRADGGFGFGGNRELTDYESAFMDKYF